MGISDHHTYLLRNLYAGQEATVRTGHGTTDWFQIGKGVRHPAYLTYMQSTSCEMPGWMKHKLESRLLGEISITSDMQTIPPLCQKAITSWQVDGETVETMTAFIFLGSKISADGDCSHEIRRRLFLGRKVMTNLDSMLKSRDITLLTKVCIVKAMVFPVVKFGCEKWTIKKGEQRRLDVFEL